MIVCSQILLTPLVVKQRYILRQPVNACIQFVVASVKEEEDAEGSSQLCHFQATVDAGTGLRQIAGGRASNLC